MRALLVAARNENAENPQQRPPFLLLGLWSHLVGWVIGLQTDRPFASQSSLLICSSLFCVGKASFERPWNLWMATMTVQTEYSALNMISNFPNSCIFRLSRTAFVLQHFKVKSLKKSWQQFRRDFALLKIVSACQKPVRPSPPSTTTVPPLLCYMWKRREWRTYRTYYDPRTSSWCSFFVMLISSHNLGGYVSALGNNNEWCDKCDARLFFMAIQQLDCCRNNYLHTNECFWSFTNLQNRQTGGEQKQENLKKIETSVFLCAVSDGIGSDGRGWDATILPHVCIILQWNFWD